MNARRYQRMPPYRPQIPGALITGARIDAKGSYTKRCKDCRAPMLMMKVSGSWVGLRWFAFDPTPVDIEPLRYFRVHQCGPAPSEPPVQTRLL